MDRPDHDAAGQPSPIVFLPSLRDCHSPAGWTAGANAFGINLNSREAQFVDSILQCGHHGRRREPVAELPARQGGGEWRPADTLTPRGTLERGAPTALVGRSR